MAEKMAIEKKKCMTPKFRVSYPHVFKPHAFKDQEPKFSIVMLFDKSIDLKALKIAAHNAAEEKWPGGKWKKDGKPVIRMPFRDGEEKADQPGYENVIFISSNSKTRPQVIAPDKSAILEEDDSFYAGCYARATLIAFAYDQMGNKGVSFALQNLQKLGEGERFSGKKNATDEFDAVEDGSENASNYATTSDGY